MAYECFVKDDSDTIGLLAYALFKGNVRDDAMRRTFTGNARDPAPSMVAILRGAAKQKIEEIVQATLDEVQPELQLSAATAAVSAAQAAIEARLNVIQSYTDVKTVEIKSHVTSSTRFWIGVLASVIAWIISLIVTLIILGAVRIDILHIFDPIFAHGGHT